MEKKKNSLLRILENDKSTKSFCHKHPNGSVKLYKWFIFSQMFHKIASPISLPCYKG